MAFIDTTPLEDAYSRVTPYVQGAPDQTVLHHLREAAIEFCSRTLIWRATLAAVVTVVDHGTYTLPLLDESALVKILRYSFDGQDDRAVVSPDTGLDLLDRGDSADAVWTDDLVTFKVSPVPATAAKEMILTVALKPSQDALEIPAFLFEHHIRSIAAGAISTISAMPRQPWSDLKQADIQAGVFKNAIDKATFNVGKGHGRSQQRVRAHFF